MKNKQKISIINLMLIIMLVMCFAIGGLVIILSKSKTSLEVSKRSTDEIKNSYASTEETTTNTWDVSENGDGSVIATLSDDGTLTISGTGNMKNWSSFPTVSWYDLKEQIKKIYIESGVTSIGDWAFNSCINLTSIEIPNSVTSIGKYAFRECTNLTSIEIPSSVENIELKAFLLCRNLTSINVNENNENYMDDEGVLYTKDGTKLIKYPEGKSDEEYVVLEAVKIIECEAFFEVYKLKQIRITEGVENIDECAFFECINIENVEIPSTVTSIGDYAFSACLNLKSIKISDSVTSIGKGAFLDCIHLKEIDVDINNTKYCDENGVLYTKDKKEIIVYPRAKEVGEYEIPKGVTKIGDYAFAAGVNISNNWVIPANLKKLVIPNSVTSIGNYAFYNLAFSNIVIPDSVITIGDGAFCRCFFTWVVVPDSVTSIGDYAFEDVAGFTVMCYKDTVAYSYVKENEINYLVIMDGINPNTKIEQLSEKLENDLEYEIKDENGETVEETELAKTGYTVEISNGERYIIIVTGDTNGDGKSDFNDILQINKHRLNKAKLTGEYFLASDVNRDGNADFEDILQINKFRLGKIEEF